MPPETPFGFGLGRPALPLQESARRVGGYCWAETRLFEALGAWVATVPELEVKALLATHARQHAWHAGLWFEQLPTAGKMTPERLNGPANEGLAALAAAVVEPEGTGQTIERLAGAYRVFLPRMITAYSDHLAAASAVADGPVIRALRLVVRDEVEAWAAGEGVLQSLLLTEEQVHSAALHQARLEWLIARAGGVSAVDTAGGGFVGQENGQP